MKAKNKILDANKITKGMTLIYNPTKVVYPIIRVTKQRIVWNAGFYFKTTGGKYTMNKVWATKNQIQKAIDFDEISVLAL